jgi:hypothetical protein
MRLEGLGKLINIFHFIGSRTLVLKHYDAAFHSTPPSTDVKRTTTDIFMG